MTPQGRARPVVTFRWDLDKTYLKTEFERFSKLVRLPFERAADKTHVPGVPELVRGLRRTALARGEEPRVLFLTATPPQMAAAIREKLANDGVEIDGIVFKDQLRLLVRGQLRQIRDHLGYKLDALFESRLAGEARGVELLFGDDWESDPLIYSIYAEWLAGRLAPAELGGLLARIGVPEDTREGLAERAGVALAESGARVERIYIHLERRTPLAGFRAYGPRLLPTFSPLQAAADLFARRRLDDSGLLEVAHAVAAGDGAGGRGLLNLLDDLVRRSALHPGWRARVALRLGRASVGRLERPSWRARVRALGRAPAPGCDDPPLLWESAVTVRDVGRASHRSTPGPGEDGASPAAAGDAEPHSED